MRKNINFKFISWLLFVLFFFNSIIEAKNPENLSDSIRYALEYQKKYYPASQYRDVYKNFMQDFYGPGHILNDTTAAGNYLRSELSDTQVFEGPDFEPTGYKGNFYRVNIGLIKEGIIPYDIFFEAFVESVRNIVPPSPDEWMAIWKNIDDEINKMGWEFNNEKEDKEVMSQQFKNNNFVVHHSDAYNKAVNFHYRIISRDNFEKIILPILKKHQSSQKEKF